MRIEKMVASEWPQYSSAVAKSKLVLPFYGTHSRARSALFKEVRANNGTAYVFYEGQNIVAFLLFKKQEVYNFLVCDVEQFCWNQFFLLIELFYKRIFASQINVVLPVTLSYVLQELFFQNGFEEIGPHLLEKKIVYHTALVLGGGGARGAYQIGVWQALKELEISFEIVTGTSVGALNGALIAQGDLEAARNMWEKIETQKILDFPRNASETADLGGLIGQISAFTVEAIQSRGVSTEPLQLLIEETFSPKKLKQSELQFFLVATEIPSFQEKNIHVNQCAMDQCTKWLLASGSFFPAMAATKIEAHYYIDGGYRNNIPVDLGIKNGATECIIVDVKGPGVTKPIKIPSNISYLTLETPWSMGPVLLFDGIRSSQNSQLGYLETMKALEKYFGYWYTFQESFARINQFGQQFMTYLEQQYGLFSFDSLEKTKKICQKLRSIYRDRVYLENIGLVLLELVAKNDAISAIKIYTINELVALLKVTWKEGAGETGEIGLVSVQEWLKKYYDDYFLFSEKKQVELLAELVNGSAGLAVKQSKVDSIIEKLPVQLLQVLFKEFIQQGEWK